MSATPPLLTIITPVYNGAAFIRRCIESIQSQFADNYEHLIMDGASVDDTVEIVMNCMSADPRIRLLTEKDKGVYDAMNKGIALAKGQWLYFLGADDYLYTADVLQKIIPVLSDTSATIVYGNVWYEQYGRIYDGKFSTAKLLTRNICHQAVFYKSSVFLQLGYYNLRYAQEADYDMNLRCWLTGLTAYYTPQTIAFYTSGGISGAERDKAMVNDYPELTVAYLLAGKKNGFSLIGSVAAAFRKIMIRYPFARFRSVFSRGHYGVKIAALVWMLLSFPFYYLISIIFGRK